MLLDIRVAGVGFKTWSIPGKADVEGVVVKGEAFMQQPVKPTAGLCVHSTV
jgi:hypothetical protein